MCEKKKTTYYYTPETEKLIEKGIEMFSGESPTGTLTKTGLIDMCIRKAVEEYPEQISELRQWSREQDKKIIEITKKCDFYRTVVFKADKVNRFQRDLNKSIQEALNME